MSEAVILDIETPRIPEGGQEELDKIYLAVTKPVGEPHKEWFSPAGLSAYLSEFDYVVGHNGVGFDFPVLKQVWGVEVPVEKQRDTFILSRLVNYNRFSTHSLDELGAFFKVNKGGFDDFSKLTKEMVEYCKQDTSVTERIWKEYERFVEDPKWADAIKLEHDVVRICKDINYNGFKFDKKTAKEILADVLSRMAVIEEEFQREWPPVRVEDRRLAYRTTAEGEIHGQLKNSMDAAEGMWELDGNEVVFYKWKKFNPGSTKDRIDVLWEAGWKPFDKSKTHQEFSRAEVGDMWRKSKLTPKLYKEKKAYFDYYGYTVSEENLNTLPETAPEGAKKLAEWLTLEGRRSSLQEWIDICRPDGRIHPTLWFIGAWTHRMSHSAPNSANIASPYHGDVRTPVEAVKAEYDARLRSLWQADGTLVGTDADGIQLRILAHYLKNDDYVHAIVSGRKEDETDIHNLNRKALALDHLTRDHAKTFIYAWLLGAGTGRVASILSTSPANARQAMANFLENTDGLTGLKTGQIVRDAARGYFVGVDGRRVLCGSQHLMLAGYLQNAESIIMKRANVLWREWADKEKINYKQVNFVHDEWQTECFEDNDGCERLGYLQRESIVQVGKDLKLYCPLAGSTDFGTNWLETH